MNYSPTSNYGMSQYLSTHHDSKRNSSSKKSFIVQNPKKEFLSEAFVKKTIEDLETQVSTKVKTLRKSQYSQLASVIKQSQESTLNNQKQRRGKSASYGGQRPKYTVNYSGSLQEMTKNLVIYDQLCQIKKNEKDELVNLIKQQKLDIKHSKQNARSAIAVESDLFRESNKITKVIKRKNNDCFFFEKEISEITAQIPELRQGIEEYKALNEELKKRIDQEREVMEEEQALIPKLLSAIDEIQYQKDRLSTEIVKQQKLKERLNQDIIKLICESNSLFKRTEKNVMNKPQQFVQ
ncbi:UNKNOWN [Stylonychia lemnae]|uniref:Uncharacterized protein n=1 Tax=Stylonychia lemnae TaxID=5949 RepID=A0A078B726_STYLE|nr:UNKNOWN [Stylonychia lemnae]|eukprot:CDW90194.1 UNKNOWN [Stylonychia lemnae]